jgi:hypothetical protein
VTSISGAQPDVGARSKKCTQDNSIKAKQEAEGVKAKEYKAGVNAEGVKAEGVKQK